MLNGCKTCLVKTKITKYNSNFIAHSCAQPVTGQKYKNRSLILLVKIILNHNICIVNQYSTAYLHIKCE